MAACRVRRKPSTSVSRSIRSRRRAASVRSGWYCRYGPSVNTRELLVEEGGFVYDSDAYNDDLPYYVAVKGKRQLIVPYSMTYNDGKFGSIAGIWLARRLSRQPQARSRPALGRRARPIRA